MAALIGIMISVLVFRLLSRTGQRLLTYGASVILPIAAALLCGSWHCLLLIPLFIVPLALNFPEQPLRMIPPKALTRAALIPESILTQPTLQAATLCLPFQPEDAALRRRGGSVLFNTAVALCADVCDDADALSAYALAQGFDASRLLARMPRTEAFTMNGLHLVCHQDVSALRWFACAEPPLLLPLCTTVLDGNTRAVTPEEQSRLFDLCRQLQADGQSLHAFACSDSADGPFTYLGLAGLRPHLIPQSVEQIKRLKALGARPILWASSSPERAWRVAVESGLAQPGDCLAAGADLASLTDEELIRQSGSIRVLQGLDRTTRRRFVHAYQQSGQKLLSLDAGGLSEWENALLTRRKLEAWSRRLTGLVPSAVCLSCTGVALGAALRLWPVSLLTTLVSLSVWLWLFFRIRKNVQTSP